MPSRDSLATRSGPNGAQPPRDAATGHTQTDVRDGVRAAGDPKLRGRDEHLGGFDAFVGAAGDVQVSSAPGLVIELGRRLTAVSGRPGLGTQRTDSPSPDLDPGASVRAGPSLCGLVTSCGALVRGGPCLPVLDAADQVLCPALRAIRERGVDLLAPLRHQIVDERLELADLSRLVSTVARLLGGGQLRRGARSSTRRRSGLP